MHGKTSANKAQTFTATTRRLIFQEAARKHLNLKSLPTETRAKQQTFRFHSTVRYAFVMLGEYVLHKVNVVVKCITLVPFISPTHEGAYTLHEGGVVDRL